MSTHHKLTTQLDTVHWGCYDAALAPVLTIKSGDTVTVDSISGGPESLPPEGSGFTVLSEHREILAKTPRGPGPHLLTGPIAVDGAQPGDALKVEILDIQLRQNWGFNLTRPLLGALPDDFPNARQIHIGLDAARAKARMPWGLEVPTAPFFGCMGVAPPAAWGRQTSVVPRAFGGNIDNRELVAGTTLYLPVFHPGALFSVGDGHAAQGHGEVNLTAIETALTGTFRLSIEKAKGLTLPRAETPTHVITMAFDTDLDQAVTVALREMIQLICDTAGLAPEDAYALCSVAADLVVTQVVDGNKGIHVTLPRWALAKPDVQ
jgi:acetamidase/formamidase